MDWTQYSNITALGHWLSFCFCNLPAENPVMPFVAGAVASDMLGEISSA